MFNFDNPNPKVLGICIIILGILSLYDRDATFFVFALLTGICLLRTKDFSEFDDIYDDVDWR